LSSGVGVLPAVFFTLLHDPSLRVRRSAMGLMGLVAVAEGAPEAGEVLQVLACKLRDR
jgi:hypothetical protein